MSFINHIQWFKQKVITPSDTQDMTLKCGGKKVGKGTKMEGFHTSLHIVK